MTETLFLAVTILDGYLGQEQVTELEIASAGALFVAAKFEETCPPDVRDFTFIAGAPKQKILAMEVNLLSAIEFALCSPTAAHFLTKYRETYPDRERQCHLMHYMLELALLDARLARCPLFYQAAGAVLLSGAMLEVKLSPRRACHTEFAEQCVRDCAQELQALLRATAAGEERASCRKFLKPEFALLLRSCRND